MRIFLLSILTLCSFISSAQIVIESNTENLLANNTISNPTENDFYNSNSSIPVENIRQRNLDYRNWYKFSLFDIGIGVSSVKSDLIANNQLPAILFISVLNFNIGFESLGGIGFGTKVFEVIEFPNNIGANSILPIYAYYPLYVSDKEKSNLIGIPSMLNFYAGGSLWSNSDTNQNYEDHYQTNKYLRLGFNYMFYNFSFLNKNLGFGNGNFALDTGVIFYENRNGNIKNIIHLSLMYSFAGFTFKRY